MATVLNKPISIFKTFLDIVLPPVCYVCKESCSGKYGLCEVCLEKIWHIPPPYCLKCGRRVPEKESTCGECKKKVVHVQRGFSCCEYKDTIKHCIHLFKYNGYVGLVDIFKDIMTDFLKKHTLDKEIDLIVPVPMYRTKKRERTYNHAEVLARSISQSFSILIDSKNLKKIRWTQSQSELDKQKRLRNVKDSFITVDKNVFRGKNVLLVDDVYTTGATINECARVLSGTEPRSIYSLTLARSI